MNLTLESSLPDFCRFIFNKYDSSSSANNKKENIIKPNTKTSKNSKELSDKVKYNDRALIIDTETTGLTISDEFIEITTVLVKFDQQGNLTISDKYTGLREPNVEIKPKAQMVHNIDQQMLENKNIDHQKLYELFNQTDLLVAHNISFDKRFIKKEFEDLNNKTWLCSMIGIRWYKKGFNSKGLQYLIKAHDIEPEQTHRSESDVMALIKLLNYKASSNNTYFNQLLRNYNIEEKDIEF